MNLPELAELARKVAEARRNELQIRAEVAAVRAQVDAENAELFDSLRSAAISTTEAELELKAATVATFNETGGKCKQWPGTSIRLMKAFIYDKAEALKWAIEHELCLALDTKAFEGLVKSNPLDFVKIEEQPSAAIASDLSKFLKEV
jgi:hypothetical protein